MRPSRCRATSAAAAAPKSRIIGGAGTGVPPFDPPVDVLVLLLLLLLLLLLFVLVFVLVLLF